MLKTMYEQRKSATSKDDTITPRSTMKQKYQPDDGITTVQLMDLCDNVLDIILCELQLDDLANVSDTSRKLRGIAGSVFSRRHAHHIISLKASHHNCNLSNRLRGALACCKHGVVVRISDITVWFKLLRNFGASIKYLYIENDYSKSISIALQNLIEYVSEFCGDSLEALDVYKYPSFTLTKSMKKLQKFYFCARHFENLEAIELMPNLRTLKLVCVPKTMTKNYAKLERVDLVLDADEEVETFISFVRMNPQIKHLSLSISFNCKPEHNVSMYSSIADHLTQLKTLKLHEMNAEPKLHSRHHFKTVETFFISYGHSRHIFEFDDLKKVTLQGWNASPYSINFAARNRKLKILKLDEDLLDGQAIRDWLSELPELEQIIILRNNGRNNCRNTCSTIRNVLGKEWEQFEKEDTDRFQPSWARRFLRFRKIDSRHPQ